jgi:hypothetical protein
MALVAHLQGGQLVHHPEGTAEKLIFVMSMTHGLYVAQKVCQAQLTAN